MAFDGAIEKVITDEERDAGYPSIGGWCPGNWGEFAPKENYDYGGNTWSPKYEGQIDMGAEIVKKGGGAIKFLKELFHLH